MATPNRFPNQLISEHELKEFIHLAMLIPPEKALISTSEKFPFTTFFQRFIDSAPRQFEDFKIQLREKLTETKNWKTIEIDLKNRLIPELDRYIEWHGQNKALLQKFNPYNPYDVMLLFIQNTRTEILKYFPGTFKSFIESHKEEALKIDISKENNFAYQRLETQKDKLKNSSFESEVLEVKDLSERAVKELKESLQRYLRNNHYKATYKNQPPRYIIEIRLYFEYLDLYNNAIGKIPHQTELKPDEGNNPLSPNEYPTIFKNDFGYNLFNKMHDFYKSDNTPLANYSFLFHSMEKDYLVCSQREFVEFLGNEKYDIQISKIDSRQSGQNKKSHLYNSTKDQLQKKHGISTI